MAKTVVLEQWQIQFRRIAKIKWQIPDGTWHDRGQPFDVRAEASDTLAIIRRMPGAGLFEFRLSPRKVLGSKAIGIAA